ncbi:hypothetical protein GDO81_026884 [Engystomops pustulosus]|uniref:Uncharacterized protein n=1 Tax=Engystomops pustulosus TaxID=76066 RepID=A0AAV6ZIA5_ENGPU|nr:hypothetical protein GDO81_026884 [Engystomops pustulosus]
MESKDVASPAMETSSDVYSLVTSPSPEWRGLAYTLICAICYLGGYLCDPPWLIPWNLYWRL